MFDFDKIIDRKNTDSLKWNVKCGELAMWVADMDFETAPAVKNAVKKVAEFGVFGYKTVSEKWYNAIVNWWCERHGVTFEKDWLCFCTGVIPAVTSMVKSLTEPGDSVAIFTPVYDIFFHSIENSGRLTLECPLIFDGESYSIDFEDLERKLALPSTKLLILCNPHNPVGKIWDKVTLQKIGEVCEKCGVTVISDEIHCDLTEPGKNYVPFISASETCKNISVTCVSASKAFNLAGMQSAAVVIPNETLFKIVERGLNSDEVAEPNSFAIESAVAAFSEGGSWLDELREYISSNRKTLEQFVKKELPDLNVIMQDATYLIWIDVGKITDDSHLLCKHVRKTTGLKITAGGQYRGNGKTFVRINVACPKAVLKDGLERLKNGVNSFVG